MRHSSYYFRNQYLFPSFFIPFLHSFPLLKRQKPFPCFKSPNNSLQRKNKVKCFRIIQNILADDQVLGLTKDTSVDLSHPAGYIYAKIQTQNMHGLHLSKETTCPQPNTHAKGQKGLSHCNRIPMTFFFVLQLPCQIVGYLLFTYLCN